MEQVEYKDIRECSVGKTKGFFKVQRRFMRVFAEFNLEDKDKFSKGSIDAIPIFVMQSWPLVAALYSMKLA